MKTSLQSAFNFTDEDLAHNRKGQMSESQLSRLRRSRLPLLGVFIFLIIAAGFAANIFIQEEAPLTALPCVLIVLGIFFAVVYTLWRGVEQSISQNKVVAIEGIGELSKVKNTHLLTIGKRRFTVSHEQVKILSTGKAYRVFHPPKLDKILSIEEI